MKRRRCDDFLAKYLGDFHAFSEIITDYVLLYTRVTSQIMLPF